MMAQVSWAGSWNGTTVTYYASMNDADYQPSGIWLSDVVNNSSNEDVRLLGNDYFDRHIAISGSFNSGDWIYRNANGSNGKLQKDWRINDNNSANNQTLSVVSLFQGDKVKLSFWGNKPTIKSGNTDVAKNTSINADQEITMNSNGSMDFSIPKGMFITSITVIHNTHNSMAFDQTGKAGDKDGMPYYRFRLSDRYFNEPSLSVSPVNANVTYSVENYGSFPKEVAVLNTKPNNKGDVLFKNLGWCKVTASANGMSTSYLVEVWDNVADYITENDGTKFRFTEAGELHNRIIRAVGGIEVLFGIPRNDEEGGNPNNLADWGNDNSDYHYQPNTTVVSLIDGHYVSSTRADNGWWDRWTYKKSQYPKQGTYYFFKATEKGKLRFGGIKTGKASTNTGEATVDIVNSTDPFADGSHITIFGSTSEGYMEVSEENAIELLPGDVYYMHGTTPEVADGASPFDSRYNEQWAVFQLEWFSFETEFKITEDGTTDTSFGVAAKSGYDIVKYDNRTVVSRPRLTVTNGVSIAKIEYKGKITSADVSIQSDGHIKFSNIQFSTSDEDKMGGAIKVTFQYGQDNINHQSVTCYREYVQTIPYGQHVWDFRKDTNQGADYGDFRYDESGLVSMMNNNTNDWNRVYKVARKVNGVWDKDNPKDAIMVAKNSIRGNNAFYMDNSVGLVFLTGGESFGAGETVNSSTEGLTGDQKMQLPYTTIEGADLLWMRGSEASIVFPGVKAGQYVKIYHYRHADNKGETFRAKNFVDLDNVAYDYNNKFIMRGMWDERFPAYQGDYIRGAAIFRVPSDYEQTDDVDALPTLTLDDEGWAKIYKIEIMDEFKPDLVMTDDVSGLPVDYDGVYGSVVIRNKQQVIKSFYATTGQTHCQHVNTCDYEVIPDDDVQVSVERKIKNSKEDGSGVDYNQLFLRFVKGTGLVKVIQRERASANGTNATTDVPSADLGYVIDKNEYYIAVGELDSKTYPFTWDFTDYNMYQGSSTSKTALGSTTADKYGNWNAMENEGEFGQKHMVEETFGTDDVEQNATTNKQLFAQGSQLTAGTTVIAESEGLGFSRPKAEQKEYKYLQTLEDGFNIRTKMYDAYDLQDNGFQITGQKLCGAGTIIVPDVAKDMYVFVKGTAPSGVSKATKDTSLSPAGGVSAYKVTSDGDVVLSFANGSEIEMIGVTNIQKSVNKLGFATESRNHAIDHTYTGKFTSNDVNAYIIIEDNYNYENYKGAKISLGEPVDVIPENTGVVLYKAGTTEQTTAPLFYPAVNAVNSSVDGNMMVACVESQTVKPTNGDYTTFIMSMFKGTYNKTSGQSTEPTEQNYEGFYPIQKAGTIGANKAYLQILTSSIPKALWDGGNGQGNANQAKGYILIDVDYEGYGETTAIDRVSVEDENATGTNEGVYYNLSGQKLQGTPTVKGIYVKNGKKVYVK